MSNSWRLRAWQILYLIGLPTMGVSGYMLHEAIYPGRGIFLDLIVDAANPASPSLLRDHPPGNFSQLDSLDYWFLYYIPFALGAILMAIGWYLRHSAPVPPHEVFDETGD